MTIWLWGGFLTFILVMLWLDLGVINRSGHVVSARRAIAWTGVCIAVALIFNVLVYFMYEHHWLGIGKTIGQELGGKEAAALFFTGWLVEYSLSLDNIFVIALVFQYFRVPKKYQHRVLVWGVLGALVMRGVMILVGAALIKRFEWTMYVFGVILLYSAFKMLLAGDAEPEPEKGWVVRAARRLFTVSPGFEGQKFFTTVDGRFAITPMFLVLLVVETTDVVFAIDSIPAIFGITSDPFLVFTSNVFAILGLRSLYFALAAIIDKFRYLKVSLVVVLGFVGVKMLLHHHVKIPIGISLSVIVTTLALGVVASLMASRRERRRHGVPPIDDLAHAAELAWKRARRVVILVMGLTIMFIIAPLTGLIPGPGGIAVFIAGLALLATEFVWARKLLGTLKKRAAMVATQADQYIRPSPKLWPVIVVDLLFVAAVVTLLYTVEWHPRWIMVIMLGAAGPLLALGYWTTVTIRYRMSYQSATATTFTPPIANESPSPSPEPAQPNSPPDLETTAADRGDERG